MPAPRVVVGAAIDATGTLAVDATCVYWGAAAGGLLRVAKQLQR